MMRFIKTKVIFGLLLAVLFSSNADANTIAFFIEGREENVIVRVDVINYTVRVKSDAIALEMTFPDGGKFTLNFTNVDGSRYSAINICRKFEAANVKYGAVDLTNGISSYR